MAETRIVDSYAEHGIDLELRFTTECSFEVGQNLAFVPIRVGGDLVMGYTTGRIRLFQSETGQFAWEYLTLRKAKQLATENLGTVYIPCRLYPGLCARAKTTLKFVDPDNHPGPDTGEPQAPFERGEGGRYGLKMKT